MDTQEVVLFGRTESARSHLSFKGKSLETGALINRISSQASSFSFDRIASDQSLGGIDEQETALNGQ